MRTKKPKGRIMPEYKQLETLVFAGFEEDPGAPEALRRFRKQLLSDYEKMVKEIVTIERRYDELSLRMSREMWAISDALHKVRFHQIDIRSQVELLGYKSKWIKEGK